MNTEDWLYLCGFVVLAVIVINRTSSVNRQARKRSTRRDFKRNLEEKRKKRDGIE